MQSHRRSKESGKRKGAEHEGFKATVFYHEYDHLDGILHIDKCDQLFDMTLEEMKEFRNKNPYRVLSRK